MARGARARAANRAPQVASAAAIAAETSATIPPRSSGKSPGSTGPSGTSIAPVAPIRRSHSHATGSGTAATTSHAIQGAIGHAPAAGAEERVERGEQRRQQQRADHQPRGPVGQHVAHRDDAGRRVGERGPVARPGGVDAADGAHRGAPERLQTLIQYRLVRGRAALAGLREQHRGQALGPDRALRGDRHRQRAPDPLADGVRAAGVAERLAPDRGLHGALEAERQRARRRRPRHDPRLADLRARHVAEHDHAVHGTVLIAGPRARAREAGRRAGGRDEHERLVEVAGLEHATELEQRRGAGQAGQSGCVAVGEHDDLAIREAGARGDHGRTRRAGTVNAAARPRLLGRRQLRARPRRRARRHRRSRACDRDTRRSAPRASRTRAGRRRRPARASSARAPDGPRARTRQRTAPRAQAERRSGTRVRRAPSRE